MTDPNARAASPAASDGGPGARPLRIWAVSDGRAGIENQALGLAEAVARLTAAEVERRHVRFAGLYASLPTALQVAPQRFLAADADRIAPPWPDLWIATGRASLPFSLRVKRWSGGRTFVVQTQDPRLPPDRFDLVVPPKHDGLTGANVFPIVGAPHRITPERLAEAWPAFAALLDPLPRPRVAVLIGGKSGAFDLPPERARTMADEIAAAVQAAGGSVMLTFSRRTPAAAKAILAERLNSLPGVVWDGEGPNPLFAFLHAADHILVTEDSANMATEAASTGKPVHLLAMAGESAKFARLHAELEALGAARRFAGRLDAWHYSPLRETERTAAEILRRLNRRD